MLENLSERQGEGKFVDRREEPRFKMKIPAAFTVLRREDGSTAAPSLELTETLDLSPQGLCLLTPHRLNLGDVASQGAAAAPARRWRSAS